MDVVYVALALALWGAVVGLAAGCRRLAARGARP